MAVEKIEPGAPESQSADLRAENLARLKALFPELVTERQVDGRTLPAVNVDVLKSLVALDLDGTLIDSQLQIRSETIEALSRVRAQASVPRANWP